MSEPTEMELRVAKAMYAEASKDLPGTPESIAAWVDEFHPTWLPIARAAIQAMREPTVTMMKAPCTRSVKHAIECYQAMISAALSPTHRGG